MNVSLARNKYSAISAKGETADSSSLFRRNVNVEIALDSVDIYVHEIHGEGLDIRRCHGINA